MNHNPFAAPDHGIDRHSPIEQSVNGQFKYMGFWNRVLASIVDNILIFVALLPLAFALPAIMSSPETADLTHTLISSLVTAVVIVMFWHFKQATPGKMIFSARIVDAQTLKKPTLGKYILRYIGYIPSFLVLGLGLIWVAIDKKKRGWHDMIAGTIVITPGYSSDRRPVRRPVGVNQNQGTQDN